MKQFGTVWVVCALWIASRCSGYGDQPKLHILTTFLPLYCFASNVAGDAAVVENLLPGSSSPHDYQLSPSDIRKIVSTDLIVVNGLGVETFLGKAIVTAGLNTAGRIVTLSDGLSSDLIPLTAPAAGGKAGSYDPHIWLDPILAAHCVTNLLRALQKTDAQNADVYARNAAAYTARLQKLNDTIAIKLAPVKSASFVTYHDAFRYFVRRYNLKLAGVVERVPEVTPSPKEMGQLLKVIRDEHAKALFTEPAGSSRLARQIAADAGINLAELDPLETGLLQPDTYEILMKRNAETLTRALR